MKAHTFRRRGGWGCTLLAAALMALLAAGMNGCETTEGAGRDLQNLGESIEDAAED